MSEYAKKLIKKICIIFCVSFAGMFTLLWVFMSIRERESDYEKEAEVSADTETVNTQSEKDTSSEEEERSEEETLACEWGLRISSKERMDFHRVLLEEDYRLFEGEKANSRLDEKFTFAYPKNLYHRVEAEADEETGRYSVTFRGKDNSAVLTYSQESHIGNDEASLMEEMYEEDIAALTEAETLLHLDAVYVVTGFEEDGSLEVYKVVRADEENLYTMVIKTPIPEGEDTKTLLSFYTEYLYRSCGFSGSSREPRSYVEFLRGDE